MCSLTFLQYISCTRLMSPWEQIYEVISCQDRENSDYNAIFQVNIKSELNPAISNYE